MIKNNEILEFDYMYMKEVYYRSSKYIVGFEIKNNKQLFRKMKYKDIKNNFIVIFIEKSQAQDTEH